MTPVTDPAILAQLNGPSGLKPVTDPAILAQLNGTDAPPPEAPKTTSQTLGFEQGVGNFLSNAAQPAIWAGKKLGMDMSGFEDGQNIMRNPEHAPGEVPGKIGRFGADVLESAPLAALAPAGIAGTLAAGAGTGALTADPGHQTAGALLGAGGGALLHGLGKAIAPEISPEVQRLADAGVRLTPGQVFGGVTKGLEDRAAGFPLVGDFITGAKNRSLEDFSRAGANRALAPIGQEVPKNMVGHDVITHAGDQLSNAYDTLLPQMQVNLGGPFSQAVQDATQRADARLPSDMSGQLQSTLQDVYKKLYTPQPTSPGTYAGTAAKDVTTDLGQLSRSYSGDASANGRELGSIYGGLNDSVNDAIRTSNPALGPQLDNINQGYANLVPVERAAASATGNAGGKAPGVFTPQQLRTAVRQGDNSVRDRATARGTANMQDLAEDGIQVLPSSVGDSGTAGRNTLAALLAGGGLGLVNPYAAAASAVIPALYSKPGIAAVNAMYAHGSPPAATALGQIFQQIGRYGGGAAGGLAAGGR